MARAEYLPRGADAIRAADAHNNPGQFTTLVAYEYINTADDNGSLHRNMIFAGSDRVAEVPFSRMHSRNPEELWDWMDQLREAGVESLAILDNSSKSNGHMFELEDWAGDLLHPGAGKPNLSMEYLGCHQGRDQATV